MFWKFWHTEAGTGDTVSTEAGTGDTESTEASTGDTISTEAGTGDTASTGECENFDGSRCECNLKGMYGLSQEVTWGLRCVPRELLCYRG